MMSVLLGVEFFVNSANVGTIPQLFLMTVYGYLLFRASGFISAGSEMMLTLYSPGIVGGLLIPILGALPEAIVILYSGLAVGSPELIQKHLNVGIGTLAGSDIMLLTLPWGLAILLGRRDIDPETGEAAAVTIDGVKRPLYTKFTLTKTGITTFADVPIIGRAVLISTATFLVIQIPAFFHQHDDDKGALGLHWWALAGFISALTGLAVYVWYQIHTAAEHETIKAQQREAARTLFRTSLHKHFGGLFHEKIKRVFAEFDKSGDGYLERTELVEALKHLGLRADRAEISAILDEMDGAGDRGVRDGRVSFAEFSTVIQGWMKSTKEPKSARTERPEHTVGVSMAEQEEDGEESALIHRKKNKDKEDNETESALSQRTARILEGAPEDDEEESEEEEEDFAHLTDAELITRALLYKLLGTAIVAVFADPMVEVLVNLGASIHVDPFYLSFVVTPFVSNVSEVLTALNFSRKKTGTGISMALSSLYGSVVINNTFCLSIFYGVIFFRTLAWTYTSEVLAILIVTGLVVANGWQRTIKAWQAILVLSLFPLSLVFVFVMDASGVR